MENSSTISPAITSASIIAGLGSLEREEICAFLTLLEEIDSLSLAKGAMHDLGKRLRISDDVSPVALEEAKQRLMRSPASDAILRHRLWVRLANALDVPKMIPLSSRSAHKAGAALAVRASERLSPAVIASRKEKQADAREEDLAVLIGRKAADVWNAGRDLISRKDPLPFPDLVREELLNMLADEDLIKEAAKQADPEMEKALRDAHGAAQKALAAGGGWVAFAAIVGNAGFLPYLLAAHLSAWIPLVSGPALVSFLATMINPLTVIAGVGALGWLALGRGSQVLRSQVAARICVLLALPRSHRVEEELNVFLADMRSLDHVPSTAFDYLSKQDRQALRARLSILSGRLLSAIPAPAGSPPPPWNNKRELKDVADAAIVASLTAGEMLWHAAAIDENVLKAADFSRAADLGDPLSFAGSVGDFAREGAGYSLRGYTAERLVLDKLVADGHDAKLAEASNTPGLDLIVDGKPVQVKCGTEFSNLEEHFGKYPDIPVIANQELLDQVIEKKPDWAHLVTTVPGFQIENLEDQISEALGHAADLIDPDIVAFALSVGILRGGVEVMQGKIPITDLPAWLILDGASRGVLSMVGAKAGGWIGLVVIGPAGAFVLGPAIGCAALLGNSSVKGGVQKLLMRSWLNELFDHAADLHSAVTAVLERRIHCLMQRTASIEAVVPDKNELVDWMAMRSQDDVVAALEDLAELGASPTDEQGCIELLFKAADIAPADAEVLRASNNLNRHFASKPGLHELLVENQLDEVKGFFERNAKGWFGA